MMLISVKFVEMCRWIDFLFQRQLSRWTPPPPRPSHWIQSNELKRQFKILHSRIHLRILWGILQHRETLTDLVESSSNITTKDIIIERKGRRRRRRGRRRIPLGFVGYCHKIGFQSTAFRYSISRFNFADLGRIGVGQTTPAAIFWLWKSAFSPRNVSFDLSCANGHYFGWNWIFFVFCAGVCGCWCWLAPAADRRRRFSQFSLLLAQVGQRHVHQREMTWLTHKLTSLLGIVSTRWPHFIHVDVFLVRNASAAPLDAPCRQQPTILIHFSVHLFQLAFLFSFFPFFSFRICNEIRWISIDSFWFFFRCPFLLIWEREKIEINAENCLLKNSCELQLI